MNSEKEASKPGVGRRHPQLNDSGLVGTLMVSRLSDRMCYFVELSRGDVEEDGGEARLSSFGNAFVGTEMSGPVVVDLVNSTEMDFGEE